MKEIFRELLNDIEDFDQTPEGYGYNLRLDLADIIYRHLAKMGWTQKKLAEAAGMKSPLLTRILHSTSNCTFETAGRVLFALKAPATLTEVEPEPPALRIKTEVSTTPVNSNFLIFATRAENHGQKETGISKHIRPTVSTQAGADFVSQYSQTG
jgi:transcriptional regulator with XRE-family HTH domain